MSTSPSRPPAASTVGRTVFTNGVFDMFHGGHANLLARARAEGDRLIVGVTSDASNAVSKRVPKQPWAVRSARVAQEPGVDLVLETPWTADLTPAFYAEHGIAVQVQGDRGSDFGIAEELGLLKVIGRTEGISTSKLIAIMEQDEVARHEDERSVTQHAGALLGEHSAAVRRVAFEGEHYVVKRGRARSRTHPVASRRRPAGHRMGDEHRRLAALRARLDDPSFVVEPVWSDGDEVLILRSAPPTATNLLDRLRAGEWDEPLLARIVRSLRAIHDATRDDPALGAAFADASGPRHTTIDLRCRCVTDDRSLQPRIDAFVERSRRQRQVLLHGEPAPGNILTWADRFLFQDLEAGGYGDRALDVGHLLAHLLHEAIAQQRTAAGLALISRLTDTYLDGLRGDGDEPDDLAERIGMFVGIVLLARLDDENPAGDLSASCEATIRAVAMRCLDAPTSFGTAA